MKNTTSPDNKLISRAELARRWDVHPGTIARREKSHLLQPIKLNCRLIRYKLEDIERIERDLQSPEAVEA